MTNEQLIQVAIEAMKHTDANGRKVIEQWISSLKATK